MRIAVAGGTGLVGRLVVREAELRGHEVVVLARSTGIELAGASAPNTELVRRLAGVEVVIDTLNASTLSETVAVEFFAGSTRTLLAAEADTGVAHHLALSIVGVDRAPYGYYAGKRAQERAIESSATPWTVLRATQFHEFACQVFASGRRGPLRFVPTMRTRPVAAHEVASRLVRLAELPAQGYASEFAGPREESLVAMVRALARTTGHRGPILPIRLPGDLGRAQRGGTLLPGPDAELGELGFAEWLAGSDTAAG